MIFHAFVATRTALEYHPEDFRLMAEHIRSLLRLGLMDEAHKYIARCEAQIENQTSEVLAVSLKGYEKIKEGVK
jgi:hypothetical protein